MNRFSIAIVFAAGASLLLRATLAVGAPCLIVTLTGTAGGPQQPFNGLACAGTLVRYGDDADNCGAVKLQFDAGYSHIFAVGNRSIALAPGNPVFAPVGLPLFGVVEPSVNIFSLSARYRWDDTRVAVAAPIVRKY